MAEQPTEKTCTKCGETKPLEEFAKGSAKYGRRSKCRNCMKEWWEMYSRRPEVQERRAEWAEKNKAQRSEYHRRWHSANKEEQNAKARARYAASPGAQKARSAARYAENRDAENARRREWYIENAERVAQYRRDNRQRILEGAKRRRVEKPHVQWRYEYNRRCRKFGLTPVVGEFTKADVIAKYGDHCAYCDTGAFEHLDHYVSVKDGGPHTLDNVRPACAGCNQAKSDADPEEWLADQAEFDALTEDEQNALIDAEIAKYLNEED